MSTAARLRRVAALGRLAVGYSRHTMSRLVRRGGWGGLAAFDALYRRDRISRLTPEERAALAGHGRCIACGLCTFAATRSGYLTAERLPLQLTRSLPEVWATRDLALDSLDWAAAQAVCPTNVPLGQIRDLLITRLEADGVLPPAPQLAPAVLPVPPARRR